MWKDILKGKRERPNIDTHKKKKTEKKEQKRLDRNRRRKLAKKKRLVAERAKKVKRAFAPHVGFDAKLLRYKMVLDPQTPTFELDYEMSYKGIDLGIIQLEIFPNAQGLYYNGDYLKLSFGPDSIRNTEDYLYGHSSFSISLFHREHSFQRDYSRSVKENNFNSAKTFDERLEILVAEFVEEYERMRTSMPWAMDKTDWKDVLRGMTEAEKKKFKRGQKEGWKQE